MNSTYTHVTTGNYLLQVASYMICARTALLWVCALFCWLLLIFWPWKRYSIHGFLSYWNWLITGGLWFRLELVDWFLRLSAPIFCKPIAHLFNILSSSFVPPQWKSAWISPIPKRFQSYGPCELSTNIHHPHSQPHHGTSCRSSILIPGLPLLSRVTVILAPVRLSTHRFHHLCPGLLPSHHNPIAHSTWLRHCAFRFQQRLWHRPALHPPR